MKSADAQPVYRDLHAGDVRHSKADMSKAKSNAESQLTYRMLEDSIKPCLGMLGF